MNKLKAYRDVALRSATATSMLLRHKRTLAYLLNQHRYKNLYNYIFTTYFIRGEDCGKGVLDPVWKLTGWAPYGWDIEVEVTTRCYLKCVMCEHTYFPKEYINQDLSYTDFKRLLDQLPNLKWINLTGEGSPFLNPDFMKMVRYCKSRGIYVDFSHDFVYLPNGVAEELVLLGVERIYWSLEGTTKQTYGAIRVGADFDKVVENVKRLLHWKMVYNSPLPELCFRFTFMKQNIHELPFLPDFLRSLGTNGLMGDEPSINIVALLDFPEIVGMECEVPEDVVELVNFRCKELGFKVYWSHITHIEEEKPPISWCTFWSEPYVMMGGYVVPCCGVLMSNKRKELEKLSFGNINEEPLRRIWDGYKDFRKQVVSGGIPRVCKGCRVFNTKERDVH